MAGRWAARAAAAAASLGSYHWSGQPSATYDEFRRVCNLQVSSQQLLLPICKIDPTIACDAGHIWLQAVQPSGSGTQQEEGSGAHPDEGGHGQAARRGRPAIWRAVPDNAAICAGLCPCIYCTSQHLLYISRPPRKDAPHTGHSVSCIQHCRSKVSCTGACAHGRTQREGRTWDLLGRSAAPQQLGASAWGARDGLLPGQVHQETARHYCAALSTTPATESISEMACMTAQYD